MTKSGMKRASIRATIKDIARLANVSHSTVSRALAGSSLVTPETAKLIRKIADQTGYRPSAAARSLVTSRSATIGVVVTTIADPFAAEVVQGIEDAATEHNYSVILANSNAQPEREVKVVRSFEERRVDGIIVTSSRVGASYAKTLSQTRVPIVLLNNQHPSEFMHSVMIDNFEASRALTEHLLQLGHRRIAYIGDRDGYQSDAERAGGYRAALEKAGIKLARRYMAQGDGRPEEGAAAVRALLGQDHPPTAIFCYNDMTALGALAAISERGLTVPDDVSVAGFDDLFVARYATPPLTTVRQPMKEMGRMALETLVRLCEGGASQPIVKVAGELIVRNSTAPPRENP